MVERKDQGVQGKNQDGEGLSCAEYLQKGWVQQRNNYECLKNLIIPHHSL